MGLGIHKVVLPYAMIDMKKILVICPHPDDETLGAGGTLLKHKAAGDDIYWCIVTNMDEKYGYSREEVRKRNNEITNVAEQFGFDAIFTLDFQPAKLSSSSLPSLIKSFSDVILEIKPQVLYVPFFGDAHSDHRIVFSALEPFFKSFRFPFIREIYMMEIISETEQQFRSCFKPNVFVDISDFIAKKIEIINLYETETGMHPFPRNSEAISALAKLRGAQAGFKFAEAFSLVKMIK